jgi:hypothetical protein
MPVKVAENIGLEEELPGVVPSCDSFFLLQGTGLYI